MAITIDDDTFHRWALDNGYVRLADITEFVRHQSEPRSEQLIDLYRTAVKRDWSVENEPKVWPGNDPNIIPMKAVEVAHAAIDAAAVHEDKVDDLFTGEPTAKDVGTAVRELFSSKGEKVSRELLAKFGAAKAGDVPAEKRREFITEVEKLT